MKIQPFSTHFNHSQPTSTHLTKIKPTSTHFNPLLPTSPIYQPLFTNETNRPYVWEKKPFTQLGKNRREIYL